MLLLEENAMPIADGPLPVSQDELDAWIVDELTKAPRASESPEACRRITHALLSAQDVAGDV